MFLVGGMFDVVNPEATEPPKAKVHRQLIELAKRAAGKRNKVR